MKQGDLLQITGDLREVLSDYHPHYAENPDYSFLMVLTQSCDLVINNGKCKSRYLTLAAVRPLKTLVDRELEKHQRSSVETEHRICSTEKRYWLKDFFIKLLNNNLSEYFYLSEEPELGIHDPHVVFLPLSIAIKSEHYQMCEKARFGQLTEIFRAKLGWLVGDIYSRVATPDWVPTKINSEFFDSMVEQMLDGTAIWVSPQILEKLKAEQSKRRKESQDKKYKLPSDEIFQLLEKAAQEQEGRRENVAKFLVKQASKVLTEVDEERLKELEYSLINSDDLEKLLF